jgi:hypothetical protein
MRRKRSSADLGVNYPGDLLVQNPRIMRAKPPLIKRNTIADFANTKAYQASTASIISAVENGESLFPHISTDICTIKSSQSCAFYCLHYGGLLGAVVFS